MPQTLTEFVDSRGVSLKVDREAGVIRGVKLLGPVSKNGRRYTEAAIHKAKSLYEGSKVNVNHPEGSPDRPRNYQDRLGQLKNTEVRSDGVYGDFHFNPKHPIAEQLAWDAEHSPENVGFSHNVLAKTSKANGQVLVEDILKVTSVDLVADPATTRGLFEHEGDTDMTLTLEAVKGDTKIVEALRAEWLAEQKTAIEISADTARLREELAAAKKLLDEFAVKEALAARKTLAAKLISEAKLPEAAVTDTFRTLIENAADEAAAKVLIEDRAAVCKAAGVTGVTKPTSKSQHVTEGATGGAADGKDFASRVFA